MSILPCPLQKMYRTLHQINSWPIAFNYYPLSSTTIKNFPQLHQPSCLLSTTNILTNHTWSSTPAMEPLAVSLALTRPVSGEAAVSAVLSESASDQIAHLLAAGVESAKKILSEATNLGIAYSLQN